jgi:hypothetical protein
VKSLRKIGRSVDPSHQTLTLIMDVVPLSFLMMSSNEACWAVSTRAVRLRLFASSRRCCCHAGGVRPGANIDGSLPINVVFSIWPVSGLKIAMLLPKLPAVLGVASASLEVPGRTLIALTGYPSVARRAKWVGVNRYRKAPMGSW